MVAFPISKPIMLITPESHGYNSSRESEKVTVYLAIPDRTEILLGRNKGGWVLGKQPPCLLYDFSFYCVMTNPLMRWVPSFFSFFETLLDMLYPLLLLFSRSVMSDSLRPHGLQQASLPCPSPFPGASSDSCPLSWWCHPNSVDPFSSCLQSSPATGSFLMGWLFTSGGQIIGASALASVLPMNIQDRFPLGLTGLISLLSLLTRVSSNTTAQNHQFFGVQPSLWSNSHIHTWLLEKPELWLYGPLLVK